MPFVRETDSQDSQPPTDARKLFIGRIGELLFFVQNILKPEEPTHNIISIWGQGGVGKSTLLLRFIDEARSGDFKDYCLTGIVDERQITPVSIMEKFADQLHISGDFGKALRQYKEALRKLEAEQETMQDKVLRRAPDFTGAALEGTPFAGPLLREVVKATTGHLIDKYHTLHLHRDKERLEDPIDDLTRAFIEELNRLTNPQVTLSSLQTKRHRRVILFFDTFEQLAVVATPWLLDYFLQANISNNVVLVVAGRDPIERSTPAGLKRWLPYLDDQIIYSISLDSFTEIETRAFLAKRGITDSDRIATIWQLSGGLPLYLGLLTSNPLGQVDPTKDVVVNFLRWIPEQEKVKRQIALDAALLSRPFNQDDLEAFSYLSENDQRDLYQWLRELPFVRTSPQDGRHSYHELVQALFSRHLYQRSKKAYYATRRSIANYYERLLEEIQKEKGLEGYHLVERLELILALIDQLLSLQDNASHIKAIELIITTFRHTDAEQNGEIAKFLCELSHKQASIPVTIDALQTIKHLLQYIEADARSEDRLNASTALLKSVEQSPAFSLDAQVQIYSDRGWAYLHLKEYEKAISDFNSALILKPEYAWAYGSRGQVYRALKDYQQAIADFDRAIELNPKYAWAYGSRGLTYHLLKDYQRAIEDFDRAIELNAQYTWAYGSRGRSYQALKEYQQAIENFDYVIELNPRYAWAYEQRGRVYRKLRNYQRALEDFDHVIELDSNYVWAYVHRGITYRMLKDYQQAIADFDHTLELEPHNAAIFAQRGLTSLWMCNKTQAVADYTRGWEIDSKYPHNCWMAEWAGMCPKSLGPELAERLEMIATIRPEAYLAFVSRGVAMWVRKNFFEALQELEQVIQIIPENWDAYFWKGMTYASLGREEDAITAIERPLDLGMPPILLTPLRWFEQDRPEFYQQYVVPLMARYDLV